MFKKRFISFVLVLTLVLGMTTIAMGDSQSSPKIMLNGTTMSLKDEVYINEKGQIMCPLREITEELGYSVTWNGQERSVELTRNSDIVKLKIGQANINVNGKDVNISSSPIIKGDRTFVAIELFSNILDLIVGLDFEQQVLKINQSKENIEDFFTKNDEESIQKELNDYMNALEENQYFNGSVLVAKDGKILLNEGYGYSDLQQNTMNKSQTKFGIGSVTKQFTAMAIMQLSEKGLLDVDDNISKYIPDFPNGDEITVHNLLTHTSGLVNFTDLGEFAMVDLENKNPRIVIELVKDKPLEFQPGEHYKYGNTSYALLGIIVENISNKSYQSYLQENIFEPLNMLDTGISYGMDNEIHDATPYTGYGDLVPIDDKIVLGQTFGAGSIYSTVEDLYRWERALNTEDLVKKQTMDRIFKEHVSMPGSASYGYGWMINDSLNGKEIWHGGNTLGFTANVYRLVEEDISIIMLVNNFGFNYMDLTDTLLSIILNEDYEMPEDLTVIKIDDDELLNKYVGRYEFLNGTFLDIINVDGDLYAQATGQIAFPIYPQTINRFFAMIIDARIEFVMDNEDEVSELIFNQLGMEIICKKISGIEEKIEVDIDPIIYDQYIGEYELAPGFLVTIIKEEDSIFAMITGQDKVEIFPLSETEYFYKVVDASINFLKDEEGRVTGLIFHQSGMEMPGPKIK